MKYIHNTNMPPYSHVHTSTHIYARMHILTLKMSCQTPIIIIISVHTLHTHTHMQIYTTQTHTYISNHMHIAGVDLEISDEDFCWY